MTWLLAFLSSLVHVALRAFQQLNVLHNRVGWVLPCSLLMGLTEVCGVLVIVKSESVFIFIPLGLGGASGCLAAMFIHRKLRDGLSVERSGVRPPEIDGDLCHEWK